MYQVRHFIDGNPIGAVDGTDADREVAPIFQPTNGQVQAEVVLATKSEVDAAVTAAQKAQILWADTNPQRRARVLNDYRRLVEERMNSLAELLSLEHGKIIADSKGDILRGLEVVEFALGIAHLQKGAYTSQAGLGIDVYSMLQPLGVCAGVTPFNFPAMIPMWMFSMAVACGNAFVLKPSERAPSVPVKLAEIFMEAGAPAGLLNVVHGDKRAVDSILDHPDIAAVSFVGSTDIARAVYARGCANGKRVQAMGGAKNHGIVMPDADFDQTVKDLVGAAYGSAGERCMALPVVVAVGEATANTLIERLVPAIRALKIGPADQEDAHFGPLVTADHKQRVIDDIALAESEGATILLDGRDFIMEGHEGGFFLGPTLIDHVTSEMQSYQKEIFGPVLQIMRADSFEQALSFPSNHPYGNGVAIFTREGNVAREFALRVNVGMVGINIPIPVPVAYHSFGGWKNSAFGDCNQYGTESVRFYTKTKTVTQRWPGHDDPGDQAFVIPTMK